MRITEVKAARKDAGPCGRCGEMLPAGSAYRWVQEYRGRRVIRCMKPECSFRPSELTSNDKLARLYEIQEEIGAFILTDFVPDDVTEALEDWASRADEVAEEYDEAASNIEDGFGHATEQSEQATQDGEDAREWASSLRGAELPEAPDADEAEGLDLDEWADEVRDLLEQISGELAL